MHGITVWVACGLFAASMVCDLRSRRIPNALPLALLGLFAVYAAAGEAGPPGTIWGHLAIGAALLAAGFALYLSGRFGAGDGKLIRGGGDVDRTRGSEYGSCWVLAACAFALSLFALLPFDRTRRMRGELPFAVAIAPPAMAVMIPRALSHGI